ncbi:MAG: hypothetical protein EXX96DRAFT_473769, partial [Benjaminiella poitrasii]
NSDVPHEFMNCFNIMNEIPEVEEMDVEDENQLDLYKSSTLEWHHWNPHKPKKFF